MKNYIYIIEKYRKERREWLECYGNIKKFDAWFDKHILKIKEKN